jgi:hypothetical protein
MQTQLKDGENLLARGLSSGREPFYVPWTQGDGFLANTMRSIAQGVSNMTVVQVVRRTNADVFYRFTTLSQLVQMAIESLKLSEKGSFWEVRI